MIMSKKQKLTIFETNVATIYIKDTDGSVKEMIEIVAPNGFFEGFNKKWYYDYTTIYPEHSIQKVSVMSYPYKGAPKPIISEVAIRKASQYNDNKPSFMKLF